MTEKTIIVPGLVLTFTGDFSLKAIEQVICKYMEKTEYILADKSHNIQVGDKSKSQSIVLFFTRTPHDQEECRLRVTIDAMDIVPKIKHSKIGILQLFTGKLKVTFRATTYSNADEAKQDKPISYALWTLFRKFIYDAGNLDLGFEMKQYCYQLYDEVYGLVNVGKLPEGVHA